MNDDECLEMIANAYPDVDKYDIAWYYCYRWDEEKDADANLEMFGEWLNECETDGFPSEGNGFGFILT